MLLTFVTMDHAEITLLYLDFVKLYINIFSAFKSIYVSAINVSM